MTPDPDDEHYEEVAILRIVRTSNNIRDTTPQVGDGAVPKGRVLLDAIEQFDIAPPDADDAIQELLMRGELYEPEDDRLRTV